MELIDQYLEKQRIKRVNIHCVGDSMIDEYYDVQVTRISPEAPMAIMKSEDDLAICKPGGVANVANQFKHLNVDVHLTCFSNSSLKHILYENQIKHTSINVPSIPVKKRFIDNGIQVKRWDIEQENYGADIEQTRFELNQKLSKTTPDAVILSDYNKGFFGQYSNWINHYMNSITVVDPKKAPLNQWKFCTVFKPNSIEAKELSGYSDWKSQCDFLINELQCHAVVITQGGTGVSGKDRDGNYFSYSNYKKTYPRSVIGAGDSFITFLTHALTLGFTPEEAAIIGFHAGAVYVQDIFNRPIVPAELSPTKIVHPEDLKNRNFKLVFVNGCFDILHRGHLELLNFAKTKGDKLVVALNTDQSIKKLKGDNRPIKSLEDRQLIMAALDVVDFVASFDENTPIETIKKCKPDVLVKGYDHKLDGIGSDLVKEVYLAPEVPGISTTKLLKNTPIVSG